MILLQEWRDLLRGPVYSEENLEKNEVRGDLLKQVSSNILSQVPLVQKRIT